MAFQSRLSALAVALLLNATAAAQTIPSADAFFAWAEQRFPAVFPVGSASQQLPPYTFRFYSTGNYLALANSNVYILGSLTGFQLYDAGALSQYTCEITPTASGCPNAGGAVPVNVTTLARGQSLPTHLTSDGRGNFYVTNWNTAKVNKVTSAGVVSTFVFGIRATGIVSDAAGNMYVSDYDSSSVKKITPQGLVSTVASGISQPQGIAMDSAGMLYVSSWANGTVYKIGTNGALTVFSNAFYTPSVMAFDSADNLYVADTYNHAIRKVTPQGVVSTLAGSLGQIGSVDGTGTSARFQRPFALSVDSQGNVYVTDSLNHTIRKISPSGVVTTIAGVAGSSGNTDGAATVARFNQPRGAYLDLSGDLYVSDSMNESIRKIHVEGVGISPPVRN